MNVEALRARLAPELVDWFACGIDKGDAPELHLVGLQPGDLERCLRPSWSWRPDGTTARSTSTTKVSM